MYCLSDKLILMTDLQSCGTSSMFPVGVLPQEVVSEPR
jgi:hypothetical protein